MNLSSFLDGRPWLRRAAPLLALSALGVLAYANALAGSFHFDDSHSIVANPWIRSFKFFPRWLWDTQTFSVLPQNQDWRPMVLIAHALSYLLGGGLSPVSFHLVNLAIHLACVCLTFLGAKELFARVDPAGERFSERSRLWLALFAGAIFAVHPLQTETIDYVSSRSEGLTALGILAGFFCHLRRRDLGAVGWFAFGLSAKAVAIVLPALVFLEETLISRLPPLRLDRRRIARYAGYALVAAGYLAIRHYWVSDFSVKSRASTGRLDYLMTEVRAYWHYLGLFLFPVGQAADANFRVTTSPTDPDFLRALAAGVSLLGLAFALRRRAPLPVFGLAWFVVVLAPTSTLLPLAEAVNEHRPYAAVAGLAWGAAWLLGRVPAWCEGTIWARPHVLAGAAGALLLALLGASWARNRVWRDDVSLWSDVVAKAPDNGRAHLNLGLSLSGLGRTKEALAQYDECQKVWPGYAYCPLDRGVLQAALGQTDAALTSYREAGRLDPNLFYVPYYEGILLRSRDLGRSIADLRRAVRLSPGFEDAHRELASSLFAAGDKPGALGELDRALALDPGDGEALSLRGLAEELLGDRGAAKRDDERAVAAKPSLVQARINLGWMAEEERRWTEADRWYREAATFDAKDADLWRRIARVSAAEGQAGKAQEALARADELSKTRPVAGTPHLPSRASR